MHCGCYSKYLSQRDYDAFTRLFEILDVKKLIKYGTFTEICENYINKDGDVREIFLSKILQGRQEIKVNKEAEIPKILLIDEVDVFFGKDFFGAIYRPEATISGPEVEALIDYIWYNRANRSNLSLTSV